MSLGICRATDKPLNSNSNKTDSNYRSLNFLIVIILGVGGLLAAAIGLGGQLQIGLLSQMNQTVSITLMAAGSVTALVCLILGIAKLARSSDNEQPQETREVVPLIQGGFRQITLNNQQLVAQGYYRTARSQIIPLQKAEELEAKTKIFPFVEEMETVSPRYTQKVCVIQKDCLDVAKTYVERGDKSLLVLFAGPEEVGGGFIDGSGAGQEERILYRSDLTALFKYYHDEQTVDPESFNATKFPLFTSLIHTPEVRIFRDSSFAPLEKTYQVGILISAAPVSNAYQRTTNSFDLLISEDGPTYAKEETKQLMKRMIYTQLKTGYDCGYETIVLGAFGCGAFQNPAPVVANLYREVIETYFDGAFKQIVFAILDARAGPSNPDGNVAPFKMLFPSEQGAPTMEGV